MLVHKNLFIYMFNIYQLPRLIIWCTLTLYVKGVCYDSIETSCKLKSFMLKANAAFDTVNELNLHVVKIQYCSSQVNF